MWTVEDEVNRALEKLSFSTLEIKQCGEEEASIVRKQTMETFVRGIPIVWWHALKTPIQKMSDKNGRLYEHLKDYIPNNELRCWFIPESESKSPTVYDTTVDVVIKLIGECFFFEYYLVGKKIDWIVIENDHNEIIISKTCR